MRYVFPTILIALSAALFYSPPQRVARVIDGDTVVMSSGERVRLAGIDAPETGWRALCPAERALAARATERLVALLAEPVRLERTGLEARFGRTVGLLWLPDGREAGAVLRAEGLAQAWTGSRAEWCAD